MIRVLRGMKAFHPGTGMRKYIKIEAQCMSCKHTRVVYPHELENALEKSKLFIRFRCGKCRHKDVMTVNRQWFEWNWYGYDLWMPW